MKATITHTDGTVSDHDVRNLMHMNDIPCMKVGADNPAVSFTLTLDDGTIDNLSPWKVGN